MLRYRWADRPCRSQLVLVLLVLVLVVLAPPCPQYRAFAVKQGRQGGHIAARQSDALLPQPLVALRNHGLPYRVVIMRHRGSWCVNKG